jgi:hypothetical protein
MAEPNAERWRRGSWAMWGVLFRVLGSVMGGVIAFAAWLIAVLARMPRPPAPPSFAVTVTAPVITAAGFAVGMLVAERLTKRRQAKVQGAFLWPLSGCTVGALVMFPFGGMLVGFGLFGLGTAAVLVREVLLQRE